MTSDSRDSLVITGCGAVSPAGLGVQPLWDRVRSGSPTYGPVEPAGMDLPRPRQFGLAPLADGGGPIPQSRLASLMALAAEEAIRQAGWDDATLSDVTTGLCAATSKGDTGGFFRLHRHAQAARLTHEQASEFPLCWPDGPGRRVAGHLGVTGPMSSPVAACATGTHALIRAARMIQHRDVRRAVVVAGDCSVCPLLVAAFERMGVLSDTVCRPFDRDRSGFVISEGAAAVTLELADEAIGRPIVQLAAMATAADPTGLAAQDETGATLAAAIARLLRGGRIDPEQVEFYSAHATATVSNDLVEARAIGQVFASHAGRVRVMAAKSSVGHMLGAAGLTEAVLAVQALRDGIHPPVANLDRLDDGCEVRVARSAEPADMTTGLCASLGFGGQIGLLAIRKTPGG